jgi:branched-chain amino acid transport system permease protein
MRTTALIIIILAGLVAFPFACTDIYYQGLAFTVLLSIATASAWNICGGYAGQYSFGHAAYFGAGAYTTLLLLTKFNVAPLYGTIAGVAVALVLALITGAIVFRHKGHYFGLASIAVAGIISEVVKNCPSVTNGTEGVNASELPPLLIAGHLITDFNSKVPFYYMALTLVIAVIGTTYLIQKSKLGFCLQAIREDQDAACSLGINLKRYKNTALAISAVFTALAGSLFGLYIRFIDVNSTLSLDLSIEMIIIAIIGGVGTVFGSAVGAIVLIPIAEVLRSNLLAQALINAGIVNETSPIGTFLKEHLAHAHVLIYGVAIVLVILFMPQGILGFIKQKTARKPV